jgi:hypothetical protein
VKAKKKTKDELSKEARVEFSEMVKNSKNHRIPSRTFEVGEMVRVGLHDKCQIIEKHMDGLFYYVHCFGFRDVYGKPTEYDQFTYWFWDSIHKIDSGKGNTTFAQENDKKIDYKNSDMYSLIHLCYSGLDFNPDYQRDFVWDLYDKTYLIDSIYNNIDIGKFSFIKLKYWKNPAFNWERGIFYEILDGKQRLTTILDFYEDKFNYRGFLYSQLSGNDRGHFIRYPIVYGETEEPEDRKDIYKYFLKLNTCGKPLDKTQLDKVRKLAEE